MTKEEFVLLQQQHQQSGKSLKTFLKDAYASMYCVHHRNALHRPTQGIEMPNAMHCIRHRKALRWIRGRIREKKNRLYFADERRFICQRKAIHPHMKRLSLFVHDSLRMVLKYCFPVKIMKHFKNNISPDSNNIIYVPQNK